MTIRILVSACLLGEPVRYDGKDNARKVSKWYEILQNLQQAGRLIPVCPETLGGLPTPRPAAELQNVDGSEILNGKGRIITPQSGCDVTAAFIFGAERTLEIAKRHHATAALLASRSPSCGSSGIYNGSFSGTLRDGLGVTVALLEQHGIRCFGPERMQELLGFIQYSEG
tara:strand:- start:46 stop:555 length:510 start_codon:yes stop_codon:yes gene_type:complete